MAKTRTKRLVRSETRQAEIESWLEPVINGIADAYSKRIARRTPRRRLTAGDLIPILHPAYRAVRRWRRNGDIDEVVRVIREINPRIDFRSSDLLVLLRGALPGVDVKRVSKWAAALDAADFHRIKPSDLAEFLRDSGGIEGAARVRAQLWATVYEGEWAARSPLRRKLPQPPFHIPKARIRSQIPRQVRRWIDRLRKRERGG